MGSLTAPPRVSKVHQPVRVTARFVLGPEHARRAFACGGSVAVIVRSDDRPPQGYALEKIEGGYRMHGVNGKVYDLDTSFKGDGPAYITCDCADRVWRDRLDGCCKHCKAIYLLQQQLKEVA